MKTPYQRIVGINLAVVLLLAVIIKFVYRHDSLEFMYAMALALVGQLFVVMFFASLSHTPGIQQAYWLSALLVLLIGFGTCCAGAAIHI